ncbi:MAG: hypothetical protein Q9164_003643 [Protoblastenia rupestris]
MRRRCDNYINATHILKVANYDKPARTRILEREVQKGIHEKIQGGYGKYQGTWIPLESGRKLADHLNILLKVLPILDYVQGDVSPPPAPKHTTNSNKPRAPKAAPSKKHPKPKGAPKHNVPSDDYDNMSTQLHDDDSQDADTIDSASYMDGDEGYGNNYMGPPSRKRKRGQPDFADQQHMVFADALLDYFILSSTDGPSMHPAPPPQIPHSFQVNRAIDDHWHTALHWAVAMGDMGIVRLLIHRGAELAARNQRGETPLIRAVLFTNNFEKQSMEELMLLLCDTITDLDHHGASILHHIVMTTNSRLRRKCALYYLNAVLQTLSQMFSPQEMARIINIQDKSGDTALHIAVRYGSKKCVRALLDCGAHGDIHNGRGETADRFLADLDAVRQDLVSSSPPVHKLSLPNGVDVVKAARPGASSYYRTEPARSFSQSFDTITQEKGLQVALALDAEAKEKDDVLEEAQEAYDKAEQDRHEIRQATSQLITYGAGVNDDQELQQLQQEYETQAAEAKSYSEQIQHRDIHRTVRDQELALPKEAHYLKANGAVTSDQLIEEQTHTALGLAAEQNKRRKLTTAVVEARALAGMGPQGEAMKQLVSVTMGVPKDEVTVHLVNDLWEELEGSKAEVERDVAVSA